MLCEKLIHRIKKLDVIFLFFMGGYILYFSHDYISLSSFWDETKVYFLPLSILEKNILGFFKQPLSYYHRPPGLLFMYLPFLKLFGTKIYIVRIVNLIIFCLGIFFSFKVFCRWSKPAAYISILFFLLTPIVQVYSLQFVAEPQMIFLFFLILYLMMYRPELWGLIFVIGYYSGTCRETAIVLTPAMLAYYFMNRQLTSKLAILCFAPVLGFLTYMGFVYYKTGDFFHHLTIAQGHIDLFSTSGARLENLLVNFLIPYRLVPLLVTSFLFLPVTWKNLKTPFDVFCIMIFLGYAVVYSGHGHVIPRYFLPCFPFLLFFLIRIHFAAASSLCSRAYFFILILLPPMIIGEPGHKTQLPFYSYTGLQDTLTFPKIISMHEKAVKIVKDRLTPGALVMTSWPFIEILRSDWIGYGVSENYKIITDFKAGDTTPEAIIWTDYPEQIKHEIIDLILKEDEFERIQLKEGNYRIWIYIKRTEGKGK